MDNYLLVKEIYCEPDVINNVYEMASKEMYIDDGQFCGPWFNSQEEFEERAGDWLYDFYIFALRKLGIYIE